MTKKEFLLEVEQVVTTEMVKEINLLLNQKKTNFLSLGLFLKLPIEFVTQETDLVPFNKKMTLDELAYCFSSAVYQNDTTVIKFIFLHNNDKHLKHLLKVIKKYPTFFAYHYVKQLQHVLRNHYTTAHQSFMLRNTNASSPFEVINLANDFAVNSAMCEVFKGSQLSNSWKDISTVINYNETYQDKSETDILKELAGHANRSADRFSSRPVTDNLVEITCNETKYIIPAATNAILTTDDTEQANLAYRIYDTIRTASRGSNGPGCQTMMRVFESVPTDTAWFSKLKTTFEKDVYYKTESFKQTWKQLNNRYRHLFPAPTTKYKKGKVDLILSVDQSGSMSELDLQKLLYLIEANSKKINKCTVLVHTATLDKVFTLEAEYDIQDSPNWKFLQSRLTNGGTSHEPVFAYIQDNIKDTADTIYLSLSDNYSDIEQCINKYPVMKTLSKYWLSPIGSRHLDQNEVGGINITMN